ncbi:MAG: hypothetical protein DMG52_08660 [Acidobacteria bacterium]|nr:MAG: hypothetical protein DMG52_08660 [Acidobacteriota bacterium]
MHRGVGGFGTLEIPLGASENRLAGGRRPEPQAGAEKLLRGRNYLRRDFTGMRAECRKRSVGLDN